jgi:hypothetical protein
MEIKQEDRTIQISYLKYILHILKSLFIFSKLNIHELVMALHICVTFQT